jgi:hypothetical protein
MNDLIGAQTSNLLAYSIVPQPTTLTHDPNSPKTYTLNVLFKMSLSITTCFV